MKKKLKLLWQLFLTFFRIGAFTFGGGYAMIPMIEREVAEKKKWITGEELLEVVAVAESTPGPIAVNAATYVGYRTAGFAGAVAGTLGIILPSFAIILALSALLRRFYTFRAVRYAFMGIRAGVLALIIRALVSMYRKAPKNVFSYVIMALAFIVTAALPVDPVYVIIGCAVFGLVHSYVAGRREKE